MIIQNLKLLISADNSQFRSVMADTARVTQDAVSAVTKEMKAIESLSKGGASGRFKLPGGIGDGAGKFADQGRAAYVYRDSLNRVMGTIEQLGQSLRHTNAPFNEMAMNAVESFRKVETAAERMEAVRRKASGQAAGAGTTIEVAHQTSTAMQELSAAGVVAHAETKNAAAGISDFGAKLTSQRAIIRDTSRMMGLQTEQLVYSALGLKRIGVQSAPAERGVNGLVVAFRAVGNVSGGVIERMGQGLTRVGNVFDNIGRRTQSGSLTSVGSTLGRFGRDTEVAGTSLARFSGGIITATTVGATMVRTSNNMGDALWTAAFRPTQALVNTGNTMVGLAAKVGLVNYNVKASMDTWNALSVMKGPGKIVETFDRLNAFVYGSVPPLRQVAFIISQFVVPALAALASWMTRVGNSSERPNPALVKLGHSFGMLANSIRNVGAGYRVGTMTQILGGFALFGTLSFRATAGAIRLGFSIARLADLTGVVGLFGRFAVALGNIAHRATGAVKSLVTFGLASHTAGNSAAAMAKEAEKAQKKMEATTKASSAAAGSGFSPWQKFKTLFSEWAPTIATVGIGLAAVAAAAKGFSKGFKDAATFEQWDVAFSTMLGSAKSATKVMKDLETFSAETPFRMPELVTSARNLLAFQVSADQLIPTLKVVGDLAAGAAQPIGDIADLYGKMKSSGVIGNDFLMELQFRGIPIITALMKEFGATSEMAIRGMAEQGKLAFPDIQKAMVKLTSTGGQFAGMMDKQSTTINGLMSTLADNISLSFKDIAAGIMKSFGILKLLDWFTQLTGFVRTNVVPGIVGSMDWMATRINAGITLVYGFFDQYWGAIAAVGIAVWEGLGNGWAAVVEFIVPLAQGTFAWLSGMFTTVFGVDAGTAIKSFRDAVAMAFALAEWAGRNWMAVLGVGLIGVELGFVRLGGIIMNMFTSTLPAYVNWFAENWIKIFADSMNFIGTLFTNMYKNIVSFFSALWQYVSTRGKSGWQGAWTPLLEGFKATMAELPTIAERQMGPLELQLSKDFKDASEGLTTEAAQFVAKRMDEIDRIAAKKAAGPGLLEAVMNSAMAGVAAAAKPGVGPLKLDDRMLKPEHNFENKALQRGSAEAFSAVSRNDARNKVTNNGLHKIADLAQKQTEHQQGIRQDVHVIAQNAAKGQIQAAKF